jgi:peptidoglycan/LPS O-acetylase OafA/YrhL
VTVTQQLSDGGAAVRETVPSSDVVRTRFGDVDGLRALAIAAIVAYQVARSAGLPQVAPALAHLASDASQGLALFLALSAFSLAYPAFAVLRADGAAYLDVGRFAIKRFLRVYPAFLAVTIVAAALHPLAILVNFPALSHDVASTTLAEFARNALFIDDTTGNDGARAVSLALRCYLAFPFLLALWARAPRIAIAVAVVAGGLDVATAIGHRITLGAIVPLVLGIAAADARAQNLRVQRVGLPLAAVAAALAFALEPRIAALAGAVGAPDALRVDPLWSIACFGTIAGIGASRLLERIVGFAPFRLLGAASYAISLVAMPVAAFAVKEAPGSLGKPALAALAAGGALAVGFALWQIVDRWFAADGIRRVAADRPGEIADRVLAIVRLSRVVIGSPVRPVGADKSSFEEAPRPDPAIALYAPPPRPAPVNLAVLSTRTGSADDLAAEIMETKRRLTERTAAYFTPEREPALEPAADAASEPAGDPFEKPGVYKRAPVVARPAPAARTIPPSPAADPSPPAPPALDRSSDLSTILPPAPPAPAPAPEETPPDAAPAPRAKASLLDRVTNRARQNGAASEPLASDAADTAPAVDPRPPAIAAAADDPEPAPIAAPVRAPMRFRIGPDRAAPAPDPDRG